MAVLEIVTVGDPVLRAPARPVTKITKRLLKLARDMAETMYEAQGVGLAAPQVGEPVRLIVVDVGDGPITLFNPGIKERSGKEVGVEGCLSIPGVTGYVERDAMVTVEGLDKNGKTVRYDASGLLARAFQHEIDHLDGILFTDKATGISVDGMSEAEQAGGAVSE